MSHYERKKFVLPSGYTMAQSWAALRKAWLGFKIALSNGDTARAADYASFITKVQTEMGIQVTYFDTDITDEEEEEADHTCFYKSPPEDSVSINERTPDYDSIMEDARSRVNSASETQAPPRSNIFDSSESTCWYVSGPEGKKTPAAVLDVTTHYEKSCKYIMPETPLKPYQDTCFYIAPTLTQDHRYETQSQDGGGDWESGVDKTDEGEEDKTYDEQDEINQIDNEDDVVVTNPNEEAVVGGMNRSCYYKATNGIHQANSREDTDFQDNSTNHNEEVRESSGRRSCFYKSSR